MEDSSASNVKNTDDKVQLGMGSFGTNTRQQFGEHVRLAMACIEGSVEPVSTKAMPSDESAIHQRLQQLSQDITSSHADLLELLVRFDDVDGWKSRGASHCAAWMNSELGISMQLGWEYLRVGRKLRLLPTTTALFRAGKISWSKIRLIVRVANSDNEKTLCHAALDSSVTDVKRLCSEFRWAEDDEQMLNEQFRMQQHSDDITMFGFEKTLRGDSSSFDTVRSLAPTRYRFRIVNADGQDIRMDNSVVSCQSSDSAYETDSTFVVTSICEAASIPETASSSVPQSACSPEIKYSTKSDYSYPPIDCHSIRVECGEPLAGYDYINAGRHRYDNSCRYSHHY